MLKLTNLSKTYRTAGGEVRVLAGVSLRVEGGAFVAVGGPSGCGKSTLLMTAGGLLAPDAGSVVLDGDDLYALAPDARAGVRAACVGFVFQQFHLVSYLDVLDNVLAPSLAAPGENRRDRAEALIERFGLADRRRHTPDQLSTGERQRTALARALLNEPKVLLADEPTGNLDEANAAVILDELARFAAGGGAVLMVTHDRRAAARADRAIAFEQLTKGCEC